MKRLRRSILNMGLIGLLLAACISAQAGVVSLTVTSEGVGPGSSSNVVFRGCAVKFTYIASDCDEHDSDCCWDDLTFPVWPEECPLPTKVNDTIYMGECTITCDWTGPKDFVFKADDQVHCTNQENDDLATRTITITGVEVDSIVVQNAPWLYAPNAPVCPCEGGTVELTAVTNPVGYEHLIPWSGGGVPETGTGALFETYWTTPGLKTVRAGCGDDAQTMDIEVAEPFYDASFLDLTGPVGGTTAVKYQVRTRCVAHDMPHLETRHTASDPWTDDDVIALGETCTANLPDENGITTYMYPLLLWQTIDRVTDGNGVEHNLDKVGDYLLRGTTDMTSCTSQQAVTDTQTAQVGVKNLTVESTLPEGVVFWTGEEGTTIPIQVTIEDNDLSDPVTLTLRLYNTGDDNRGAVWSPSATLRHEGITDPIHTFYWNGTPTGESYDTNYLPEGTYTFEVTAIQADENLCLNCNGIPPEPPCIAGDEETYRSEYLKIVRASDESGNPIYDVECEGYDDNGTPEDESDDKYIYVIRKYVLRDSLGVNASEGVIWLYDPEGEMVHDWDIAEQDCILHTNSQGEPLHDGLHATADGLDHALRIRVPVEKMPYAGTYRFVLHIRDNHANLYRRGGTEGRWALDLNCGDDIVGYAIYCTNTLDMSGVPDADQVDTSPFAAYAETCLQKLWDFETNRLRPDGYKPWCPAGNPENGGSGLFTNKSARATIHTLDRFCPTEVGSADVGKSRNAVWAYYGHGVTGHLDFPSIGSIAASGPDVPNSQRYSLANFSDLKFLLFVYLAACHSGEGNPSVAAAFRGPAGIWAKAVIGFFGAVEINDVPLHPFGVYNKRLWRALCEEGMTVTDANQAAKDAATKGAKGFYVSRFGEQPRPVVLGDKTIRLTPPRYGRDRNHAWE